MLNPDKDVEGNVQEAVAKTRAILTRFDEINARLGEPLEPDEMEKLLAEQSRVQDQIELLNAWELDRQVEIAMDAIEPAAGGRRREQALRRRAAPRGALQNALAEARSVAAGRADEPPGRGERRLVERHLAEYTGTVRGGNPRPLLPGQRRRWILEVDRGRGIPGKGITPPGWSRNETAWPRKRKLRRPGQDVGERAGMDPHVSARRQAKSKARIAAYEKHSAEKFEDKQEEFEIQIPPGKHLGDLVVQCDKVSKGYGDRLLFENLSFRLPAGGIVGIIGANGTGKTTLFRMIVGQEQPDSGQIRVGPTVEMGYVDQNRDALDPDKTVFEEISGGHDTLDMGGRKINPRAYVARSTSAHRPAKESRYAVGRRAEPCPPGQAAAEGLQPADARRADERPGRRHAAGSGRGRLNFAGCAVVISHDRCS